jgi:hypothetical protein
MITGNCCDNNFLIKILKIIKEFNIIEERRKQDKK